MKRLWVFALVLLFVNICIIACKDDAGSRFDPVALELPAALKRGQELYVTNGCSGCHGKGGKGDGAVGRALEPPPRNLRDVSQYKNGSSLEEIKNTILKGVPGTLMVGYNIHEEERLEIAKFIVHIQKVK